MNIAVRYYSRTGNTEKLAKAIAEEVGVVAEDLSKPLDEKADVLFLGCAIYAGGIDGAVKAFIADNKDKIGAIYSFSTTALAKSAYKQVNKVAAAHGVKIAEEEFACRGKFACFHKDRPSEEDLSAARAFAKQVTQKAEI